MFLLSKILFYIDTKTRKIYYSKHFKLKVIYMIYIITFNIFSNGERLGS